MIRRLLIVALVALAIVPAASAENLPGYLVGAHPAQTCAQDAFNVVGAWSNADGLPLDPISVWTLDEPGVVLPSSLAGNNKSASAASYEFVRQRYVILTQFTERNVCAEFRHYTLFKSRGWRYQFRISWPWINLVFHESYHEYSSNEGLVEAVSQDQTVRFSRRWCTYKILGDYHMDEFQWLRKLSGIRTASPWTSGPAFALRRTWLMNDGGF